MLKNAYAKKISSVFLVVVDVKDNFTQENCIFDEKRGNHLDNQIHPVMKQTGKRLFSKGSPMLLRKFTSSPSTPPSSPQGKRWTVGGVAVTAAVAAFAMYLQQQTTFADEKGKNLIVKQEEVHRDPGTFQQQGLLRVPTMEKGSIRQESESSSRKSHTKQREKREEKEKKEKKEDVRESLVETFITQNHSFFKRNINPNVPTIDDKQFKLEISGLAKGKSVSHSLSELRSKFPQHSVIVTLNCGRNRGNGLIGTAKFTGVWLRDVLEQAGVSENNSTKFVMFETVDKKQPRANYDVSLPLAHVMDPRKDVLLAFEMNDENIPISHGYPLRLIVPGAVGSRSVKWLNHIKLTQQQTGNGYQELPINSGVCVPSPNSTLHGDTLDTKGWAFSGGGRSVIRVDLTIDGGKTWHEADLINDLEQEDGRAWAWTRWQANIELNQFEKKMKEIEICSKAVDSAYNTQPEKQDVHVTQVAANNWHCVKFKH